MDISVLKGQTITNIIQSKECWELIFETAEGNRYIMHHIQDCCEQVYLEDIGGDLNDLIGSPVLQADEEVEGRTPTYTFYRIATMKGAVCLRWQGDSNGYYCESVDFDQL